METWNKYGKIIASIKLVTGTGISSICYQKESVQKQKGFMIYDRIYWIQFQLKNNSNNRKFTIARVEVRFVLVVVI